VDDKVYQHMMFAVDFDAEGTPALVERVAALRALCGARLSLLHVVDVRGLHGSQDSAVLLSHHHDDLPAEASNNITDSAALVPHEEDALTDAAHAFLESIRMRLAVAPGDCHVVESDSVRDAIVAQAQTLAADLIMLGHGDRHWFAWFGDHTAERVVHRAHCDVLVLHLGDDTH